jgi:hypothetical protein
VLAHAYSLAALRQAIRRPVAADWSNDGGDTWSPLRVSTGTVTADRTADVRYAASLTVVGAQYGGRAGINSISTLVRIRQGIQVPRSDVEWIPAGTYTVDKPSRTRTGVTMSLLGLEDVIRGAAFPAPRTVGPDSARSVVGTLVGEALPTTPIAWQPGIDPGTSIPGFVVDADRWAALSSGTDTAGVSTGVAQALAGEIWADARGIIVVGPVPTLDDPVVWMAPYGTAVVSVSQDQSSEGVYNLWSVTGDTGSGAATVGPAYAWDSDPNSLTYAGPDPVGDPLAPQRLGLPWVRVRTNRVSSALATSQQQADAMARAGLAGSLGIQASLSMAAVCHPALEPGDVIAVEVTPGEWETHIIDSLSFTLGSASMTCTTRTTARRL